MNGNQHTGQYGLNVDILPAGILVGLFSVPIGGELKLYNRLEEWAGKYRKEIIEQHVQWKKKRTEYAEKEEDALRQETDQEFLGYYEIAGFGMLGKFDLAIVMLVQDYGIVNNLAKCEWCDSFQFLYGPLIGRPGERPVDLFLSIKNNLQSQPLVGLCQLETQEFLSIDHGSKLLFHLADFIIKQSQRAMGSPEINGPLHIRPWTIKNHPKSEARVIPFLCHGWSEIAFLVQSRDYTEILQVVMDIREARFSEINDPRDPEHQLKEIANGTERKLISKLGFHWNNNIDSHVFNTSFTTLGYDMGILKKIYAIHDRLVTEAGDDEARYKESVQDRITKPKLYMEKEFLDEKNTIRGKIQANVAISCKPGHFSEAIASNTPPNAHDLAKVSKETKEKGNLIVKDKDKFCRLYLAAGMSDHILPHSCHFFQPIIKQRRGGSTYVVGDCHYPYQNVSPDERCKWFKEEGPTHCKYVNEHHTGFYIADTAAFLYSHCLRILHYARHSEISRLNPPLGQIDLTKGPDIYRSCTQIAAEMEFLRRPIHPNGGGYNHPYTQKIITHRDNGFSEEDLDNLEKGLRRKGIHRGLTTEIRNIYSIFNSCVRTPQLFGRFIELYPYLYGMKRYIEKDLEANYIDREYFLAKLEEAVQYFNHAFLSYFQGSYLLNEITDFNFEYKGAALQLISILTGIQRILLGVMGHRIEEGGICLFGGAPDLMHYDRYGSIIEVSLPQLHQPELLIQMGHEIGHRLLRGEEFNKVQEKRVKQVGNTPGQLFFGLLDDSEKVFEILETTEAKASPRLRNAFRSIQTKSPQGLIEARTAIFKELLAHYNSKGQNAFNSLIYRHAENCRHENKLAKEIQDILDDVMSDLFMLWTLFLGDFELFQEDFWWKFATKNSSESDRRRSQKDDVLIDEIARDIIRNVLVGLYRRKSRTSSEYPTENDVRNALGEIHKISTTGRFVRSRLSEYLPLYCSPANSTPQGPYSFIMKVFYTNSRTIHDWLNAAVRQLAPIMCGIFSSRSLDIQGLNRTLQARRLQRRATRGKLANGEVVPFDITAGESARYEAIAHLGDLFYSYYANLYYGAPTENPYGDKTYDMFEKDKPLLLRRDPNTADPLYSPDSGRLMLDPRRGLFVTGQEFRGMVFRRRAAFWLSLYDTAEKTKLWILDDIFVPRGD